jgi:nicotinamide-nucleotide amidase
MVNASIITIGDELLIGQVIDTNSAWMAKELNTAGIPVVRRVAVGDVWNEIWKALDEESAHSDIILMTGGLGPTSDDITKELLCKYFDGKMVVDPASLAHVNYLFEEIFKRPITERNLKQAEIPDVCQVIQNKRGSAPGMLFSRKYPDQATPKIYISLPGVPHEMKGMMPAVLDAIRVRFELSHIAHRTLLTAGIGESMLADMIVDFENALPSHIKLAYLPNYRMVRLRLSASASQKEEMEKELDKHFLTLQQLVKDYIVTNTDEPLEAIVGKILLQKNKTLCTAESCTGGYIAQMITSVPGASAYYDGSFVTYSYKAKEDLLNVNKNTIVEKGAVSEEVVREMANGALKNIQSDYVIAVSGIMGPGGGTPDKPVGTVWVAIGKKGRLITQKFSFGFDRERNVISTAINALNMLRKFILADE